MPAKSRRYRSKTRTILISLAALMLVGLIVGAFTARPAWRWVKAQRAERLCESAMALMEQGQQGSMEASEKLRRAWDLAPDNPVVKRTWARVMMEGSSQLTTARMLFEQLNDSGHATAEDQIGRATVYLRMGDTDQANQIFNALPQEVRGSRAALELEARLKLADGDAASATEAYMQALRTSDDPLSLVNLAMMETGNPFSEVKERAREDLFRIAVREDETGLAALERIAAMTNISREELHRVVDLLERHPLAQERHRFLRLSLQLRLDPAARTQILEDQLTAHADLPLSQSHDFLTWLLREGEADLLLRLLPLESARTDARLTGLFLQALVNEKRWRRLDAVLHDSGHLPIRESMRSLLQALCLDELGGSQADIAERVRNAFRLAWDERDYGTVYRTASFCEQARHHDLATEGFELLANRPELREAALDGLFRVATNRGDVGAMIDITHRILANTPYKENYREIRSYLQLLTGYQMELAMADIVQMVETNERSNLRQFLLAFAHHRFGNTTEARSILVRTDVARLQPGHRAVAAWILSVAGEESEAFHLARRVDELLLLNEEAELWTRVQ